MAGLAMRVTFDRSAAFHGGHFNLLRASAWPTTIGLKDVCDLALADRLDLLHAAILEVQTAVAALTPHLIGFQVDDAEGAGKNPQGWLVC